MHGKTYIPNLQSSFTSTDIQDGFVKFKRAQCIFIIQAIMKDNNTSIILITEKEKKEKKRLKERWKKMLHSYFLVLKDISLPFIKKYFGIVPFVTMPRVLRGVSSYFHSRFSPIFTLTISFKLVSHCRNGIVAKIKLPSTC